MSDVVGPGKEEQVKIPGQLPVLPLRDMVVYPFIIAPLSVARDLSIQAVDQALAENRMILLTAQKDKNVEQPGKEDLYLTGTVALNYNPTWKGHHFWDVGIISVMRGSLRGGLPTTSRIHVVQDIQIGFYANGKVILK